MLLISIEYPEYTYIGVILARFEHLFQVAILVLKILTPTGLMPYELYTLLNYTFFS